jgi:hypothetical protein
LFVAGVLAAPASSPPEGQGFLKDIPGGGAGQSECSTAHQDQLPEGQQKKCP